MALATSSQQRHVSSMLPSNYSSGCDPSGRLDPAGDALNPPGQEACLGVLNIEDPHLPSLVQGAH